MPTIRCSRSARCCRTSRRCCASGSRSPGIRCCAQACGCTMRATRCSTRRPNSSRRWWRGVRGCASSASRADRRARRRMSGSRCTWMLDSRTKRMRRAAIALRSELPCRRRSRRRFAGAAATRHLRWRMLHERLSARGAPRADAIPEMLAAGVARALASRPRLALDAPAQESVLRWIGESRALLGSLGEPLLHRVVSETRSGFVACL